MVFPLFKKKVKTETPVQAVASAACAHETGAGDAGIHCNLTRPGRMTRREEAKIYHAGPSIIDFLPWVEYLDEEQCLLLDDGVSVGAVYEVTPAATEGRTAERLEQIRDTVEDALQDSFDEYDTHPWVVQFFCQDENDVDAYLDHLRGYVKPHAQRTAFTEAWLGEMERHLRGIARPEGLFTDTLVTGQPWRGQQRRTRMVVYRRIGKNSHDPMPPVAMLNQVCERVVGALGGAGVRCTRMNGLQVHGWLLRLFNPRPAWVDRDTLYRLATRAAPQETPEGMMPVMTDFAESLWFTPPVSDPENGVWWLDGLPHAAVVVEKLRTPPAPGTLTGEKTRGEKTVNALMDTFPEGTLLCMTIVVQPQDTLEERFTRLSKNAVGENTESIRARQDVATVKEYLGNRHKLYRAGISFLLRAEDMDSLKRKRVALTTALLGAGLQPVR
ncbi:TPA: conjugative transfer ATPase, partial [Escherichia coli]|nr:conjugative transfer ATPase [Escherichia coli]